MLKALEDISSTKKRLKIEVPADIIEAELQKTFRDLQKKSKFPGFRPGKTPMSIVEKKFGKDAEAEAIEKLIPQYYAKALQEADIVPVSQPVMEEAFNFKRNEPLLMTVAVEIRPKVENLSYENIRVTDEPIEVTDEEIDSALQRLAEEKATYEAAEDAVISGDLVTIDYTVKEDGSITKDVVLKVGSGPYPAEFMDGLLNKKKEEEFSIEASFPEDSQTPFAGKKVGFDVKIRDIKRRNAAAIDDEFAKDLGFDSLDLLKGKARENISNVKQADVDRSKQREIVDILLDTHAFDAPESMVQAEIHGIIDEIRASGKEDRSDEVLFGELRPNAEKSVRATILLSLIGEKEKVSVSDDDLKLEIYNISKRFYVSPENVIKYYTAKDGSLEGLKGSVFEKKVLGLLLSKAKTGKGE